MGIRFHSSLLLSILTISVQATIATLCVLSIGASVDHSLVYLESPLLSELARLEIFVAATVTPKEFTDRNGVFLRLISGEVCESTTAQ